MKPTPKPRQKREARTILLAVKRYNKAWLELATLRSQMFPPKSLVNVDCGQYHGSGKVVSDCDCPIDKLPVLVGSGNVWWYPLIACSPQAAAATK